MGDRNMILEKTCDDAQQVRFKLNCMYYAYYSQRFLFSKEFVKNEHNMDFIS